MKKKIIEIELNFIFQIFTSALFLKGYPNISSFINVFTSFSVDSDSISFQYNICLWRLDMSNYDLLGLFCSQKLICKVVVKRINHIIM